MDRASRSFFVFVSWTLASFLALEFDVRAQSDQESTRRDFAQQNPSPLSPAKSSDSEISPPQPIENLEAAEKAEVAEPTKDDPDYTTDEEYKALGADKVARKQEYGERTTDNTRAFLRTQTPLLLPKQWQFDTGVSYTILEADLPTISGTTLTEANVAFRSLDTPFGFRYGVTERLQWFGSSAIGWQSTEYADGFTYSTTDKAGIGDVLTGFNYLVRQETSCLPSIITSVDISAPTGNARDPRLLVDSGTGLGAWTASSRFLMVKSLDPVVAFWGAGYRCVLEDTYLGDRIDIGDQVQYTFGIGFGVSDKVTLSSALIGSYITDLKVNSTTLDGTAGDIIAVRLASTILQSKRIIEPFATLGVTERAPNATFGIVWTR